MAKEIERKFRVTSDAWRPLAFLRQPIRQGYLAASEDVSVRVRTIGDEAYLTIKSRKPGIERDEFEYAIPMEDAEALLTRCGRLIEKTRYSVMVAERTWTVDEFHGAHSGLLLAECEVPSADVALVLPPWAGEEVTDDPAFRNEALARS